ncbi:RidA family protein [Nocardia transvalensis]|uniref:RidA family protein n=1 Tax=Nocardia transvalensis TaxID=37333 RepID=UPI001895AB64|nr:RidA family protein [Nocardia transvalensis]MBF6331130.1 RidA family protein [Nocardia transvalensis]
MRVLQPPGWPRPRGYANGVAARGEMVFVAGMVGWDAEGRFPHGDLTGQVRLALSNIVAVLAEAGAEPADIVRMTWYVTDAEEYLASSREIGEAFRDLIGCYHAAMTVVEVSRLVEKPAKVEIEATAVIPDQRGTASA